MRQLLLGEPVAARRVQQELLVHVAIPEPLRERRADFGASRAHLMRDDDDGHGSPRRYFSLSAVGAIAIRLPPTSSRMYTSSVSDPLANTSKTSSAASSVASGRWFIICSTAVQERRVMRSPSKSGPRVSRNGSDRQDVGPHPSPQPGMGGSRRSRGATRTTGGRASGGGDEEAGHGPVGTTAMLPARGTP